MIPVVALVGRQNVGKSTLFNRLTRTRDALVADFPGLTRDRKYGRAKWEGYEFIVIDTGGIDGTEEGVEIHVAGQSLVAIEEADIVLFMVDGRAGLMAADQGIARHLCSRKKTTVIVANKTDGINADSAVGDFYALAMGDVVPIAASHGHGINSLLEHVLLPLVSDGLSMDDAGSENEFEPWTDDETESLAHKEESFDPQSLPIKLAIVGRPNVGKSTLINRILGEERVVVYDMPGTTRDSIYIPMVRDEREYVLIDTAGVRKRGKITETVEKFSVIKTLQVIEDANVVLLVVDAYEGISDQDLSLLGFILNSGRSLVIAVNKWDGLSRETRDDVKQDLDHCLGFIDFARVHFISALHGSGIDNLFESVNEAYQCATKRVSTALLTRIMHMAVDEHQPRLVRGRRIKPKYAHAGGYNPPIVVIHGTQVKDLPDSYKRYLMNYFRRSLEIMGTPIRIQFNEATNPFASRRNILTPTQLRKRKWLMSHLKKKNERRKHGAL
ncbi:GTP-binding protein Der [Sodalis-like endosymbiont of Proechinophthirus fluctus]|uniref:ribosome biogenesis GTPase Der n=1 Tax=Sodalis-like endosymbiont of Proechinophthirus fluctus TaxID=1462730 RepID=UPI0007A91CB4|nr:ribosome biogenesis GTPase Der [Sodalis-like endosymbiont of Proechinophthirus fluctus]KYP97789.1 GTP-binding protein Der [Sodalis-like endosymbiont of Proechinophthirus fluctus]